MPYPAPHKTIFHLCAGVPLDATYRNTIWFATKGTQEAFFASKIVPGLAFTDCMYHRDDDEIRVNAPIEDCETVNYVYYENTGYTHKIMYAFVTAHRYINANCTGLKIKTDVMQTYMFDHVLQPGYIERNHTLTDGIGENLVPEALPLGDLIIRDSVRANEYFRYWDIVAFSSFDWSTWQPAAATLKGGTFSALHREVIGRFEATFTANGVITSFVAGQDPTTKLTDLIQNHAALVDGVVALVITPAYFESATSAPTITISKPTASTGIGGFNYTNYTPRNKKLYTHPYYFLQVSNGDSAQKIYRFEDFTKSNTQAQFRMYTDFAPGQSVVLIPDSYAGAGGSGAGGFNYDDIITMTGFPQAAWLSDAFKTYLAQNMGSLTVGTALGVLNGVLGVVGSAATGNALGIVGASGALAGSIASPIANMIDKKALPAVPHGQITGTAMMAIGEKAFRFTTYNVKPETAKIIDSYFDLYGYAIHKVGTPNISGRPHWCFVQMNNSLCIPATGGAVTAEALAELQQIYDRGITFWKNGAEVGDYSLDNSVS